MVLGFRIVVMLAYVWERLWLLRTWTLRVINVLTKVSL